MARTPNLKVFRMAVGFHDAYVAAPSQKAAIEAWGSDADVFRRGSAEIVSDPELTKEPLSRPGEIVKRLRGTTAEQLAALGSDTPETPPRAKRGAEVSRKKQAKPLPKPKPRPSRAELDRAEATLNDAASRHQQALNGIAEQEVALARERAALEQKQRQERDRLQARRDKAAAAYEQAMQRWREA